MSNNDLVDGGKIVFPFEPLATHVFHKIIKIYEEKYATVDCPCGFRYFAKGQCWYMAKMLKYLFPQAEIMELRLDDHPDHWYVIIDGHPVNLHNFYSQIEIITWTKEEHRVLPEKDYGQIDIAMYVNMRMAGGKESQKSDLDLMCADIIKEVLNDEYFKDKLGNIRGDVDIYGLEEKNIGTSKGL